MTDIFKCQQCGKEIVLDEYTRDEYMLETKCCSCRAQERESKGRVRFDNRGYLYPYTAS